MRMGHLQFEPETSEGRVTWCLVILHGPPDQGSWFPALPRLQELDEPEYGHLFVKRAVTRALDKHNHEREMSSILLSALYGEVRFAQSSDLALLSDTGSTVAICSFSHNLRSHLPRIGVWGLGVFQPKMS